MQLWRAWPSYDRSRTFSTWMYRIALNVAISNLRAQAVRQRHTMVPLDDYLHDLVEISTFGTVDDATMIDVRRWLADFLDIGH